MAEGDLVVCSVLSGNRNFEARIHPEVKANYLASPPLVVAYALAGSMRKNLTTGAASLLGPQGIRVNCIQLGEIWTDMAARELPPQARERRRNGVALQTEGTCWDAAYAALFLASNRARWISGHILTVDGGGPYRGPVASGQPRGSQPGAGGGGCPPTHRLRRLAGPGEPGR